MGLGFTFNAQDTSPAHDRVWEWFTAALACTLFTLPVQGVLILAVDDRDDQFAQFAKPCTGLIAEVGTRSDCGAHLPPQELALESRGWARPTDDLPHWFRQLGFPAGYAEYEALAASVAWALRTVHGLDNPLRLRPQTWTDGSDLTPDIARLGLGLVAPEHLDDCPPGSLHRMAEAGLGAVRSDRDLAAADRALRSVAGAALLKREGWQALTGCVDNPPERDRTVDIIAFAAPDRLIVVDVELDVEDVEQLPRRAIYGHDRTWIGRGTAPYLEIMLAADPDFTRVLAERPELAAGLRDGTVRVESKLMTVDAAGRFEAYDLQTVTESPKPVAAEPDPMLSLTVLVAEAAGFSCEIHGDTVHLTKDGETSYLATDPLRRLVAGKPRADWPALLAERFGTLINDLELRQTDPLDLGDFDSVTTLLRARLYFPEVTLPPAVLEQLPAGTDPSNLFVQRMIAPGLGARPVVDQPTTTSPVSRAQAADWTVDDDTLLAVAMANTRADGLLPVQWRELDGRRCAFIHGGEVFADYASAQVFWLDEYPVLGKRGALFCVPCEGAVAVYPMNNAAGVLVTRTLGEWALREFHTRHRPISPHVYHWSEDGEIRLAATATVVGGRPSIAVSEEFRHAIG